MGSYKNKNDKKDKSSGILCNFSYKKFLKQEEAIEHEVICCDRGPKEDIFCVMEQPYLASIFIAVEEQIVYKTIMPAG